MKSNHPAPSSRPFTKSPVKHNLTRRMFVHHRVRFLQLCISGLVFAVALVSVGQEEAPNPLIEELFREPDTVDFQISPTGQFLAAAQILIDERSGRRVGNFRVIDRATNEVVKGFGLGPDRRVGSMFWADDDAIALTMMVRVQGQDFFRPSFQIQRIDLDSGLTDDTFGWVLDRLQTDPIHVLALGREGRVSFLNRMNLKSGGTSTVARSPIASESAGSHAFVLNEDKSDAAFAVGPNLQGETEVHQRMPGKKWQIVEVIPRFEKGWVPIRATEQSGVFYTRDSTGANIAAIGTYDTNTQENKIVFRHQKVDFNPGNLLSDFDDRVWGVRFEFHYPSVSYIRRNHPLSQIHQILRKQYPNDRVDISSTTKDHKTVVAHISSDRNPGEWVIVDAGTGTVTPMLKRRKNLDANSLAVMNPVEIPARDGTILYGYLTSKPGTKAKGPLIVRVHGGPGGFPIPYGSFERWGYNAEIQALAASGFPVLTVNFRGSGNFGYDYLWDGWQEWSGKMQDDVTDATQWAIQNRIADPKRICIMGANYGAYSAMIGAAKEPDLYACAIGIGGVYDINLLQSIGAIQQDDSGLNFLRYLFGRNKAEHDSLSPHTMADKIKAKVLLVHGGQARMVPPAHFHRMRTSLEAVGNAPETLLDSGQGDGFNGAETRVNLYSEIISFVEKNIGI